ncbi:MAG: UDP-glucuronic acid decarboxylase family protein [bacterium]
MNILITGGAGFLGSHICEYFLRNNCRVACFDNYVTGQPKNLDSVIESDRLELIQQDVTEYIDVTEISLFDPDSLDAVLHFASPASPEDYMEYPIKTLKVGSLGTHRTLGVAKKYDASYLLASTSEVYGDPLEHPQTEDYWGNVNPIGLRGVYDESKRFAEAMVMAYHRTHDVDTSIIRIFNTYGPRMRLQDGRVVPNFLKQALRGDPLTVYGDGSQTRSFCYVDDLVDGIIKVLESNLHEPVNLGNPDEMTILEFAKAVIDVTDSESGITHEDLPEDDPERRRPDITRAREELDWEPEISLKDGLKQTIPYFESEMGLPSE